MKFGLVIPLLTTEYTFYTLLMVFPYTESGWVPDSQPLVKNNVHPFGLQNTVNKIWLNQKYWILGTFNLLYTNGLFLLVWYKLRIVHWTYLGVPGYNFLTVLYCLSEDLFTFTNSVDPDQMQHYAAFHLGLHCL